MKRTVRIMAWLADCFVTIDLAYMDFIYERLKHKNPDGSLQIMYTIHGMRL
jgi:ABC-type thiamine transport system substrate-binding protein